MSRAWLLSLLVLASCGMPVDRTCARTPVERNGNGTGTVGLDPSHWAVKGEPITVRVFAPLSACVSDPLRVDLELYDASNLPAPIDAQQLQSAAGVVSVDVTFTPQQPGAWLLRASFEPSLGSRTEIINVVAVPDLTRGAAITLAYDAVAAQVPVWPLSDGVAYELPDAAVMLQHLDGGSLTFPGHDLVVADDVLWTLAPDAARLERRRYVDGGVVLLDTFEGFKRGFVPGQHGPDFALRLTLDDTMALVRPSVGVRVFSPPLSALESPRWFFFDGRTPRWATPSGCDGPHIDCVDLADLLAVDPARVWRNQPLTQPPIAEGYAQPLEFPLQNPVVLQRPSASAFPTHHFERLPLWLESPDALQRHGALLASTCDGNVSVSLWPRARVLTVACPALVVSDSPGVVRLIPLQSP